MADKIFRDPLYNYVTIPKRDGWLLELISTPEVQRLRRIHQLGVSNVTYPGAEHTRFSHSMGVMHLMGIALERLRQTSIASAVESARQGLLSAALLHDVGHGPFSHLFEPCLGVKHEPWSIKAVLDESTGVNRVLRKQDPRLPGRVAGLIEDKNADSLPWEKSLISSQLDMDRMDYLRRDSFFTGAGYGHFDWHRILATISASEGPFGADLVWPEKVALAIEEYIFSRYYMYQNVYLHKTTRGFEKLVQVMWRYARPRADAIEGAALIPALADFWKAGERASIQQYLAIEEFSVLAQIDAWKSGKDKILADLARRFLCRDGLALLDPPEPSPALQPDYREWETALKELLASKGYSPEYMVVDVLEEKYRLPYRPEKDPQQRTSRNSILLDFGDDLVEVSDYLERLKAVTTLPGDRWRYYVPKEIRREALELVKSFTYSTEPTGSKNSVSIAASVAIDPETRDSSGGS